MSTIDTETDALAGIETAISEAQDLSRNLTRVHREAEGLENDIALRLAAVAEVLETGTLQEQLGGGALAAVIRRGVEETTAGWDTDHTPVLERLKETEVALADGLGDAKDADNALGVWLSRLGSQTMTVDAMDALNEARERRAKLTRSLRSVGIATQLLVETGVLVSEMSDRVGELEDQREQARTSERLYLAALSCPHNRSDDPEYHWLETDTGDGKQRRCRDCGLVESYAKDGTFVGIQFAD